MFNMTKLTHFFCIFSILLTLSACSTRQAGERFTGSTEQRLVTYSIQQMAKNVAGESLSELQDQTVVFESHFVIHNQVQHYAEERVKTELTDKFNVKFISSSEFTETEPSKQPQYRLKLFFTSLGTDRDQAGFSVPIINLAEPERSTSISVLAIDMYHGIAECNYYLQDIKSNKVIRSGTVNARVKTDKFTTPIFGFPISDIDD